MIIKTIRCYLPAILACLVGTISCNQGEDKPTSEASKSDASKVKMATIGESTELDLPDGLYARLDTTKGDIVIELHFKQTPLTVTNFVGLAEGTIKHSRGEKRFYDGLIFHRVVPDFVIQGGDPQGTGTGGPGYKFADEFVVKLKHEKAGVLSMANSGPGTNGSQFFITLGPTPHLDYLHSVFGRVAAGMEIVKVIEQQDRINQVEIIRIGKDAKAFRPTDSSFAALIKAAPDKLEQFWKNKINFDLEQIGKKWPEAVIYKSGLRYIVIEEGSGQQPAPDSTVKVRYTGQLLDGTVFDSSKRGGQDDPVELKLSQVITGWQQILPEMKKNEKRLIILPPDLAYGDKGVPRSPIKPYSFLVFEIELVDFS